MLKVLLVLSIYESEGKKRDLQNLGEVDFFFLFFWLLDHVMMNLGSILSFEPV